LFCSPYYAPCNHQWLFHRGYGLLWMLPSQSIRQPDIGRWFRCPRIGWTGPINYSRESEFNLVFFCLWVIIFFWVLKSGTCRCACARSHHMLLLLRHAWWWMSEVGPASLQTVRTAQRWICWTCAACWNAKSIYSLIYASADPNTPTVNIQLLAWHYLNCFE
jgi:hypothetical protein